jgi:hypothetical protein
MKVISECNLDHVFLLTPPGRLIDQSVESTRHGSAGLNQDSGRAMTELLDVEH